MRQLTVLGVGLVLITFWGIGLRSYLRSKNTNARDTAQNLVVDAAGTASHASGEPSPVASAALPLRGDFGAQQSPHGVTLASGSGVVRPAGGMPLPLRPEEKKLEIVEIREIKAGANNTDFVWKDAALTDGPVWIKSRENGIGVSLKGIDPAIFDQARHNGVEVKDGKILLELPKDGRSALPLSFSLNESKKEITAIYDGPQNGVMLRIPKGNIVAPKVVGLQAAEGVPLVAPGTPAELKLPARDPTRGLARNEYEVHYHMEFPNKTASAAILIGLAGDDGFVVEAAKESPIEGISGTLKQNVVAKPERTTYLIADDRKDHVFVPKPVTIKLNESLETSDVELDATSDKSFSADALRTIKASATLENVGNPDAVSVKLVDTIMKTEIAGPASAVGKPTNKFEADFGVDFPNGRYSLAAQFFLHGEPIGNASAPKVIEVQTGGFFVESIGPATFGKLIDVNNIQIRLSREVPKWNTLDAAALESLLFATGNTRVLEILYSGNGDFTAPEDSIGTGEVTAAKWVKEDRTLTLSVDKTQMKGGFYQVRLFADNIEDEFGNKLAGNQTGKPLYIQVLGDGSGSFGGGITRAQRLEVSENTIVTRGVTQNGAEAIEFPEYVSRPPISGFNANDKVETRVARLYYYRDAHRVAQILNRRVKSYNRQAVSVRQQLADKARQQADSLTTQRMELERAALRASEKTRKLENELSDMQRQLSVTVQEAAKANAAGEEAADRLASLADSFKARVDELESEVDQARDRENQANDRWQASEREEALAKEDQFRMEVAAAKADPDTYAAANLESKDPVAQVSISVIGEGLLHLRGPLKGINQIRIMIDQIDTPQGQVRVNVHSTQINGDEADHLEIVANRIQTYIDQARFLTVQSAEMLRKAVVHVAAVRAEQARNMFVGATQAERDQLYLHAFFGRDFIDELRSLDSEFLHTGNKLLSLHSMDVTSLSSALTLLALANNETRLAILQEFERLVQTDLTPAEQRFVQTGEGCCTERCKLGCLNCKHGPKVCYFAQNGHFTSLKGFFDANILHADTISPLQREFIKLAQIMKARLITELEYKQRVMERSVIEERLGSDDRRREQLFREQDAEEKLIAAKQEIVEARSVVIPVITETMGILDESGRILKQADESAFGVVLETMLSLFPKKSTAAENGQPSRLQLLQMIGRAIDEINEDISRVGTGDNDAVRRNFENVAEVKKAEKEDENSPIQMQLALGARVIVLPKNEERFKEPGQRVLLVGTKETQTKFRDEIDRLKQQMTSVYAMVSQYRDRSSPISEEIEALIGSLDLMLSRSSEVQPLVPAGQGHVIGDFASLKSTLIDIRKLIARVIERVRITDGLNQERDRFFRSFSRVRAGLDSPETSADAFESLQAWAAFRNLLKQTYDAGNSSAGAPTENGRKLDASIKKADDELERWAKAVSSLEAAKSIATDSRRPLDHKKFLDMLIDDLEEKYIELMEGTRAHTANIDNYLKRLTTSLDDDFNRQFYYPAFRLVREASQFKRVEFGQTETTNVLVNNRQFGKVSPSATMEFDLPERDILISEALDAGLAIYNDVGALINDPNMLGLMKSQMGGTATPPAGSLGGRAAVRSLLPGLQGDSAEQLLAQNAGSGPDFESNVERLIPDPAIYKFETGTGYEIRPVIAPDGQAVVFDFNYLYRTQIREPVRADEKHLGRVRQHFIDTDVQLSNFELREVSRYVVALKAERTANGVPLLEDIPLVGALWRPLPNREKSLQQNIVMAQATIFPTLFDLMGLRWAPTVADLDPLRISNREYLVRGRQRFIENRIYDYSSSRVDEHLQIPDANRRADLYRSQESIPTVHPNGYRGQGLDYENSQMREGYDPEEAYVNPGYIPSRSSDGALYLPHREKDPYNQMPRGTSLIEEFRPSELAPPADRPHISPQGAPNPTIIQSMPGFLDTSALPRQPSSYRRPEPMRPTAIPPQLASRSPVEQPVAPATGMQSPPPRVAMQQRNPQPARAIQPRRAQPAQTRFPEYPSYQSPQQTPQVSPASGQTQGGIVPAAPIQVGVPAGTGASSSSW